MVPVHFYEGHQPSLERLAELNYAVFALDPGGEKILGSFDLPRRSAFLLGNEGVGIRFDYQELDIPCVSIPQLGKMASLNVSVAGSVALYEYLRQYRGKEVERETNG